MAVPTALAQHQVTHAGHVTRREREMVRGELREAGVVADEVRIRAWLEIQSCIPIGTVDVGW